MTPVTVAIDVLELSRSMLSGTRSIATVTRGELVALLGFVLRQNDDEPDGLAIDFPELAALPTAPPLPPAVETAIAEVLEARRRLSTLQPRGTTLEAIRLRGDLFAAIDTLASLFDEDSHD